MAEANILLGIWPLRTGQLNFCKFSAVYQWDNILESTRRHYSNTVRGNISYVSKQFVFAYGRRDEMRAQWDIEVLIWGVQLVSNCEVTSIYLTRK